MKSKFQALSQSFTARLVGIGVLALLFLIPLQMIRSVIEEREDRYRGAVEEVSGKWGAFQGVVGPVLAVPYAPGSQTSVVYLFPENLAVDAKLETQVRSRGIFEVPLYDANLLFKADFSSLNGLDFPVDPKSLRWNEAWLLMGIADSQGLGGELQAKVGDQAYSFRPAPQLHNADEFIRFKYDGKGYSEASKYRNFSYFSAKLNGWDPAQARSLEVPVQLKGSEGLRIASAGKSTQVAMSSPWISPGFEGSILPESHQITVEGFTANWSVSPYSKSFGPDLFSGRLAELTGSLLDSSFGVDLVLPVDVYQQVTRSVKYGALFVLFSFLAFFLFEVIQSLRVHPFQYLLVGAGLSLFYLLLLSFSERISFGWSYLVASAATIGLVSAYAASTLKSARRGGLMASLLTVLYASLYLLLRATDYALLIGSVSLFIALAVIMYVTRNIDWYRTDAEKGS